MFLRRMSASKQQPHIRLVFYCTEYFRNNSNLCNFTRGVIPTKSTVQPYFSVGARDNRRALSEDRVPPLRSSRRFDDLPITDRRVNDVDLAGTRTSGRLELRDLDKTGSGDAFFFAIDFLRLSPVGVFSAADGIAFRSSGLEAVPSGWTSPPLAPRRQRALYAYSTPLPPSCI